MNASKLLQAEKLIDIRFSEVDSMNIVWHGSYVLYLEDAREAFGHKYHLEYLYIFNKGFYAPLVDMRMQYKKPLKYKDQAKIVITYRNTDSAKLIFDYEIYNIFTEELVLKAYTIQVFLDLNYELMWSLPEFIVQWKKMNGLL